MLECFVYKHINHSSTTNHNPRPPQTYFFFGGGGILASPIGSNKKIIGITRTENSLPVIPSPEKELFFARNKPSWPRNHFQPNTYIFIYLTDWFLLLQLQIIKKWALIAPPLCYGHCLASLSLSGLHISAEFHKAE